MTCPLYPLTFQYTHNSKWHNPLLCSIHLSYKPSPSYPPRIRYCYKTRWTLPVSQSIFKQCSRLLTSCTLLFIGTSLGTICHLHQAITQFILVNVISVYSWDVFLFSWSRIEVQINLTTKQGQLPACRLATYRYRESEQACCVEVGGVTGAWRECDFNQQQWNYPDVHHDHSLLPGYGHSRPPARHLLQLQTPSTVPAVQRFRDLRGVETVTNCSAIF